jgi:hypothetical protein
LQRRQIGWLRRGLVGVVDEEEGCEKDDDRAESARGDATVPGGTRAKVRCAEHV